MRALRKGGNASVIILVAAAFAVVAAFAVYAAFDPAGSVFFPKCPFKMLTGLQCPGCGTQRALHELLHLHVGEAVRYNAMLAMAVPFVAVYLAASALQSRLPRLYACLHSAPAVWTVFAVVVSWWVLRNLLGI